MSERSQGGVFCCIITSVGAAGITDLIRYAIFVLSSYFPTCPALFVSLQFVSPSSFSNSPCVLPPHPSDAVSQNLSRRHRRGAEAQEISDSRKRQVKHLSVCEQAGSCSYLDLFCIQCCRGGCVCLCGTV